MTREPRVSYSQNFFAPGGRSFVLGVASFFLGRGAFSGSNEGRPKVCGGRRCHAWFNAAFWSSLARLPAARTAVTVEKFHLCGREKWNFCEPDLAYER